jgi:hypothetical protein
MLRFVQGDTCRRYFQIIRDGAPVTITSVTVKLRKPSGVIDSHAAVVEDAANGEFYAEFWPDNSSGTRLGLDEVGHTRLEFVVDGEHVQDTVRAYVRSEFYEAPRELR